MGIRSLASLAVIIVVLAASSALPTSGQEPAKPIEPAAETAAPAAETAPPEPLAPAPDTVAPAPPALPDSAPIAPPPAVAADTDLMRRTPRVDGMVDDGEWDTFVALQSGEVATTIYADWDSTSLYFAVKAAAPVDFAVILDANADGWYNGGDNYQFMVLRDKDNNPSLAVSRYESAKATSPVAAPVTVAEAALVDIKHTSTGGAYMVEMMVPVWLVTDFKPTTGRKIGLALAAKSGAGWVPVEIPGGVQTCTLVVRKTAALAPLAVGFDVVDLRVARGEEVAARFHLTNTGSESADVRSFVLAGEGKSGEYMSSQKVRLDGLAPRQHFAQDFRSIIPRDMPLGSWVIGAEVNGASGRLGGALASFDVVEPVEIAMKVPDKPVRADVKDVTFGIVVTNNMRRSLRGTAKITLPQGWQLWKNADTREFSVRGESVTSVAFKAKPPLGVLGKVPVKGDISVDGITKSAEAALTIVNP